MNVVYLMGNLGRDPKFFQEPNGTTRAEFSMATNEVWRDRDGERRETTTWHEVVAWSETAESLRTRKKGDKVLVEGRIVNDENGVRVRASKVTYS